MQLSYFNADFVTEFTEIGTDMRETEKRRWIMGPRWTNLLHEIFPQDPDDPAVLLGALRRSTARDKPTHASSVGPTGRS
jgi:hypothetical protein